MKAKRNTLMITSVLVMGAIWGFILLEKNTDVFKGLDLIIFILIIVLGGVALYRAKMKDKEEKAGFVSDDELSKMLKYKAGHYAYLASMYMWLFIFLFKDKFPDIETMIGGGILLSGLIGFIAKIVVKRISMNNRIKELRARDNLTQSDLAKKVDVRRETIVFLEKGKYNPSLKLAYDISKVFRMSIEEIFDLN